MSASAQIAKTPAEEALQRHFEAVASDRYDAIICNYANGDMVGHTGNYEAAVQAIEVLDACIGRVTEAVLAAGGELLITADHGNAEQMVNYETGMVMTSHTIFPVECIYVTRQEANRGLIEKGKLSDIAPTVLALLGLNIPPEMTAQLLLKA